MLPLDIVELLTRAFELPLEDNAASLSGASKNGRIISVEGGVASVFGNVRFVVVAAILGAIWIVISPDALFQKLVDALAEGRSQGHAVARHLRDGRKSFVKDTMVLWRDFLGLRIPDEQDVACMVGRMTEVNSGACSWRPFGFRLAVLQRGVEDVSRAAEDPEIFGPDSGLFIGEKGKGTPLFVAADGDVVLKHSELNRKWPKFGGDDSGPSLHGMK